MRLGGAGPDDPTRVLQCEVVFRGNVLWGLLKLPPSPLPHCFNVSLRVRLWAGLYGRVRLCDRSDGCVDDVGVGVNRCTRINSSGTCRSDSARVWGFYRRGL